MIEQIAYIKNMGDIWVIDFKDIGVYNTIKAKDLKDALEKAKSLLKEAIWYFNINNVPVSCKISTANKSLECKDSFLIRV